MLTLTPASQHEVLTPVEEGRLPRRLSGQGLGSRVMVLLAWSEERLGLSLMSPTVVGADLERIGFVTDLYVSQMP